MAHKKTALPDPEVLAKQAVEASEKDVVEVYFVSIVVLRRKGYSWREIAAWLEERGVNVHHSRLHRMAKRVDRDIKKLDRENEKELEQHISGKGEA